jgi:serine/threonine-protein kinase PRP4
MASSASSDEGEIRDGSVEKATKSPLNFEGTTVDPQDRNRSSNSTSMSPENGYISRDRISRERSRSPYSDYPPRGSKRARDEDYPERARDPRRFKVHYEDKNSSDYRRRSRVSYEDLDRGPVPNSDLRYDERDRYSDKRPRTRSRSPYRPNRGGVGYGRGGQSRREDSHSGHTSSGRNSRDQNSYGYGDVRNREYKDQSVSKRAQSPLPAGIARLEAKTTQGNLQRSSDRALNKRESEK